MYVFMYHTLHYILLTVFCTVLYCTQYCIVCTVFSWQYMYSSLGVGLYTFHLLGIVMYTSSVMHGIHFILKYTIQYLAKITLSSTYYVEMYHYVPYLHYRLLLCFVLYCNVHSTV